MKKYFIAAAFCLCLCLTSNAASQFRLIRGVDALGKTTVVYTTGTTVDITPGADGNYTLDTGDNVVAYILINGTACYPDVVTDVMLPGAVPAKVSYTDTTDGPVYTVEE